MKLLKERGDGAEGTRSRITLGTSRSISIAADGSSPQASQHVFRRWWYHSR